MFKEVMAGSIVTFWPRVQTHNRIFLNIVEMLEEIQSELFVLLHQVDRLERRCMRTVGLVA